MSDGLFHGVVSGARYCIWVVGGIMMFRWWLSSWERNPVPVLPWSYFVGDMSFPCGFDVVLVGVTLFSCGKIGNGC